MSETVQERLEYLRSQIRGECISMYELAELQSLAFHIDRGDVELLEWAGVEEATLSYTYRDAFKAQYNQYREHDGKRFAALRVIEEADATHDEEVLPMFVIALETGEEIEAWPEEVLDEAR